MGTQNTHSTEQEVQKQHYLGVGLGLVVFITTKYYNNGFNLDCNC